MPIYEYSCGKCGETIEVIQKMSDPDLQKHEKCGGKLTRLLSAPAFQFKGSARYGDGAFSTDSKYSSVEPWMSSGPIKIGGARSKMKLVNRRRLVPL